MSFTEIIDLVLQIFTLVAISAAVIQMYISRKQLYLSTISKCVAEFRDLEPLNKTTNNQLTVARYLDLTNEELFYFQQNYIPKEVAMEWIDGMIDLLPVVDFSGNVLNVGYAIQYLIDHKDTALMNYPRIQNAFEIKYKYNFEMIYSSEPTHRMNRVKERNRLIKEIQANIKKFYWFS